MIPTTTRPTRPTATGERVEPPLASVARSGGFRELTPARLLVHRVRWLFVRVGVAAGLALLGLAHEIRREWERLP